MKLYRKFLIFLLFYILPINTKGYRILGVFPFQSKSHDIFCQSLMSLLAKRGHQVDVIASGELENQPENYTTIFNLAEIYPHTLRDVEVEHIISNFSQDPLWYISHDFGNDLCDLMAHEKMQKIFKKLKDGPAYDLFITEAFGMNCYMGLAHFLKVPLITLSPQMLYPWVEEAIGNPPITAFHPNILSKLIEINSFWHRLQNTIYKIIVNYRFNYYTDTIQTEIMRKYLSSDVPSVSEVQKSSALTLINTHYTFNGIRPLTTALIEIGGLHILEDEAKFTPELQKWMDESKDGVVYFSLGSITAIESLPQKTILDFFSSFAKLKPIKILMRIKNNKELPPGLPKNVKILPWIPQIPVLRHKNTKAFITHGGLLSSQEALYFGVPIIGIPIHLDQFLNTNIFVKKNMGIKINLDDISKKTLDEALTLILNNSTYREAAKQGSNLFRDRPMTARDTAIFWVEYIARNGPNILKSPAVNLHWIQNELLDVYGFLLFSFVLVLYLITIFIKAIKKLIIEVQFLKIKAFFNFQNRNKVTHLEEKKNF